MNEKRTFEIALGGTLSDVLQQLAETESLVDIILNTEFASEESSIIITNETRGVRVIQVGEDHVAIGPKRPVFVAFIPLDAILFVRVLEMDIDYCNDIESMQFHPSGNSRRR